MLGTRVEAFSNQPILAGLSEYIRWQNSCVSPRQISDDIYLESPLAHPSVMFRRHRIMAAGGYREGMFPEDYELWLRLHRQGAVMAKLPQVLLQWRDWPRRFTRIFRRDDDLQEAAPRETWIRRGYEGGGAQQRRKHGDRVLRCHDLGPR